jgi:large repetitive protein
MNNFEKPFALQSGTEDAGDANWQTQMLAPDASLVLSSALSPQAKEVVFIEGNVPDLALLQQSMGAGRELYVLDPAQDGLSQMASILAGQTGISAIHLVSHGADGTLQLGTTTLDSGSLAQHRADLQTIGSSLSEGGDILLYGCDVGAGTFGQQFIDLLAAATGSDVAASNNLTGATEQGGDWSLEIQSGDVETRPAVDADLAAHYQDVLSLSSVTATFTTIANFTNAGTYNSHGSSDVAYKVSGDSSYVLNINGAADGVYAYSNFQSDEVVIVANYSTETLVTFDFTGGKIFTPTSIGVRNYTPTGTQSLVFKGYDANNSLVASQTASLTDTGNIAPTDNTVSLTGFTNITTLKLTATTYTNTLQFVAIDDMVFSTISAPDTTPPTVSGVTSSTVNGTYKIGDVVAVQVVFSEAVNVTGTPQLTLETGTTDRVVNYASGSGSSTLVFNYTVQAGDTSPDLDYQSTSALALNGGTIKDLAGNAGILTLVAPGATGSLGANKAIVVDGVAPTVTGVTSSALDGVYATGNVVSIQVNFGEAVTVTGTPQLTLETGTTDEVVNYSSGSGSSTLTFTYTVQSGDASADLDYQSTSALALNGGTIKDAAGNNATLTLATPGAANSLGANKNIVIDATPPTTTISTAAFSADTGSSSSDFITSTAVQTISGTTSANVASGEVVEVSIDNGASWNAATTTVGQSSWSLSTTLTASDTLKVRVSDAVGNHGTTYSQAYVLDTTAPAAPSTPDMTAGTDTGSSSTDDITSNTTATFTGTAESGATVTLYDTDGTTVLGTATATGGAWSITSSALSEGAHTLTAKATDAAGNVSSASSGLSITVDTTAPAAPGTPDLASGSDTGSSSTDNITSATTPTITGTAESGATVTLYDTDGTTVLGTGTASGGNWSIASSALGEGSHTLTAKATDAAGNIGVASSGLAITVDTTAPTATISTMAFSADTGSSSTDFITKTAAQTISGTTSALMVAGEIVEVSTDNGSSWTTAVTSVGLNTWSLSGVTLTGSDTLKVRVTDTAGNHGSTAAQAYVLDTAAPVAPSTPDLSSGSDTGSSNSDEITSATTPTINGTAEPGATVTLYDTDGTTVLGTGTATGGNWSIASSALSEGSHTLTAKATDTAGNVSSASSGLSVTIDATAPGVNSVSVPVDGTYASGQTLQFTVNLDESVVVDTTGGTPRIALTIGASTDYATYVSGSGTSALVFSYTVQAGDTDANGITVGALQANGGTVRDTAGNDAALTLNSVGSTAAVDVDGVAPTVSSVSVPADGSYRAAQNLDFTVNFSEAVTVGGTPHIAVTLDNGGTVYADYLSGSGTSALVFRYTIASGVDDPTGVTIGALGTNGGTLRDAAGNDATLTLNSVGSTAAVLVDTTAPTVTFSSLAFSSDSGASSTDFITNATAQTITATLSGAPGGTDLVYGSLDGGGSWTDVTAMVSGTTLTWTGVTLVASGTLELKVVDAAGNDGPVASQSYVLDSTAPVAPAAPDMAAGTDTGSSSSDDITSNTTPTFTGTAEAGSTVTLYDTDGTTVLGTATATGGNWSITSSTLSEGAHTLTANAVDTAGNVSSASSSLSATIDTTAPAAPSTPDMTAGSDDGASSADNDTSIATPTFTGTAESGSLVTLYDTDGTTVLGSATAIGGIWSITSSTLALGGHTIFSAATDAAGNVGVLSAGLDVTIQVPGTTPPAGTGNDVLNGTPGDDVLDGGRGNDTMIGGLGNDTYYVDRRGDVVTELPGGGTDTVYASVSYVLAPNVENLTLTSVGARWAFGNDLDNVLIGNIFRNTLEGMAGADTLTGGLSSDTFKYLSVADSPAGAWDVITDFSSAERDTIDLAQVDADPVTAGSQHFTFIGTAAFSGDATAQLRFDSGTHMLYGSTNADSTPEFAIELLGVTSLTAADLHV